MQAVFWVACMRLSLWLLPFRVMQRVCTRLGRTQESRGGDTGTQEIVWAVRLAGRYVPRASCLVLALATQVLLGRHGHAGQVHIGVALDAPNGFRAHAWVECQGQVLIGGAERLDGFTPILVLDSQGAHGPAGQFEVADLLPVNGEVANPAELLEVKRRALTRFLAALTLTLVPRPLRDRLSGLIARRRNCARDFRHDPGQSDRRSCAARSAFRQRGSGRQRARLFYRRYDYLDGKPVSPSLGRQRLGPTLPSSTISKLVLFEDKLHPEVY